MKAFIIAICLCLGVADTAQANPGKCQSPSNSKCVVGPAPDIASVPFMLVVGGVMVGAMLLRRRRKRPEADRVPAKLFDEQ
jgi:uncharacterized protein (TIGR03382 family)